MRRSALFIALLSAAVLAACNGGYFGVDSDDNGNGGGSGATSDAQGLWTGTTSDRYTFALLVTPTNDVWGLSYDESANTAFRLFRGTGALTGKNFTGTGKTYASGASGTVTTGTVTGSVTTASAFDGNLPNNLTFTTNFNSQYNTAAPLSDYAGTWEGRDSSGARLVVTLDGGGRITATSTVPGKTDPCAINGALSAGASSKNYTILNLSFGGESGCAANVASQSMQGVGVRVADAAATAQPLLLLEATNNGQTAGWFAYARRRAVATGS
ncbi:hypothetical protein [Pigmentiphaga litoralis]|uniref:Lipoprotein n=1 Tax=Pigmentiphaga litoralis TaxID=516702 RepID=A0A7Y9IXR1_9BURK|nr:hypothetical protein [Pigmentiphaga litoralis]NYE25912.1 hypothetical protein [Pigmentiphaga litoralis]NYE85032.1 hypothetical protein [Pigmentiphaga litoralis]